MGGLANYRPRLERTLAERADAYAVPGAAVGVLLDDEIEVATWGVANAATGIEVTPDTLFQIGSIAKIYTATLLCQMAGAGVVALDEPVRAQLQEFALADPGATLEITPRHLLAHTSGMHGDHLIDTGWNPDALERYVATLHQLGQIHAPDETYSFCNTGFGVAGRLIEVATGEHYDRALRRRLVRPIGASATLTLPQHALVHRVAVGHEPATADRPARAVHRWPFARANGPMGGILAPAGEVLAFARLHMAGGIALNGAELLPAHAVEAMAEPQVESPLPDEDQALAWTVRRWDGVVCLGQDGDTFGQRSYLRVLPQRRFAVVVLANSPSGARLADSLWPEIVGELADVHVPLANELGPPSPLRDPTPFVGVYDRLHQRVEVTPAPGPPDPVTGDRPLDMRICPSGVLDELGRADSVVRLVPTNLDHGIFRATMPESGLYEPVVFTAPVDGACGAVYLYGRLHTRA